MSRPLGFEGNLGNPAVVRPTGGDALCALRARAVEQNHTGVLRPDFVESIPYPLMIVAASERDARTRRQEQLRLGELFGIQEIPAVERRRQGAAIKRARTPRRAGLGRVELREMVAEDFEGVAPLGERETLRDPPLKFDRTDFRAILFRLRTALRGFVVMFAVDALRLAVKEVNEVYHSREDQLRDGFPERRWTELGRRTRARGTRRQKRAGGEDQVRPPRIADGMPPWPQP